MENTPAIETERLLLRRFAPTDTEAVYRIYSDVQANRFLPWYPVGSREEAAGLLLHRYLEFYRQPAAAGYRYAICLREDDIPVGYVHLKRGGRPGFWLRPAARILEPGAGHGGRTGGHPAAAPGRPAFCHSHP